MKETLSIAIFGTQIKTFTQVHKLNVEVLLLN